GHSKAARRASSGEALTWPGPITVTYVFRRRDNLCRELVQHRVTLAQSRTEPDRTALAEDRQFLFRLFSPVAGHSDRAAEHENVARNVRAVPVNRNRKLERRAHSREHLVAASQIL